MPWTPASSKLFVDVELISTTRATDMTVTVSGVLGVGGVSAALGDDQLGGVSVALRVSVGR
jgi:hypothetical protein